ncbi:MAG TPA: hypothetical protein VIL41_03825 [Coriobacteriia bacterium]
MAPIIEQPRPESADAFEPLPSAQRDVDVPGLMADRVGKLYAEEERIARLRRTERLIRAAEQLQ